MVVLCVGQRQQAEKTSLFVAIYCSIGPVFSSLVDQLDTIKYLSSNMKHCKPKYPVLCDIYCRFVHDELWEPCVPQRAWILLLECSHQCWKTSQLTRPALTREPRKQATGLHGWDMYLTSFSYHFYSYYITPDEKQVISQGHFFNIPSRFKISRNSKLSYDILEYSKLSYDILEYSKLS